MKHAPLGRHRGQPDHVVAKRAQAEPAGTARIRRDRPAQCGTVRLSDVDRQPLPLGLQDMGEPVDADSGFDGDGHVASGKIDDAIEVRQIEANGGL